MKKSNQCNSNYSISKTEGLLLRTVREAKLVVFTPRELMHLLSWKKQRVHNILQQLKNKGILVSTKRNVYTQAESLDEQIFRVATESIIPSYISFWSALSFYGFTEQQPRVIQVVTPKQSKILFLGKYKIVPTLFKKKRFFGYKKTDHFTIAEKEKCILDSLAYPEKAGGFHEVIKCLKSAWPELDKKTFLDYLLRFNNTSLNARLGYLLEKLGLQQVQLPLPTAYVRLNNEKAPTQARNKKHRVIVNEVLP